MATIVQYSQLGGPEVLEVVAVPTPTAGVGEVVVRVKAAGVNPIEHKIRSGKRPSPPIDSARRIGSDGAGVIVDVGPDVDGWNVDDEVIIHGAQGTYATHVVVTPKQLTRKPYSLDWPLAAAIGVPLSTAYQAIASLGVDKGMTLLIHGGSGTVGQAAIQFAVRRGARVIATASEAKFELIRSLGAEPVVYGDGLLERVREAAPDGIDRILDAVGTDEAIETSLQLVDDPQKIGTLVVGARAAELGIQAWSGGNPVPLSADELALREEAIPLSSELLAKGELRVEIGTTYPLARVAEAHEESENGHPAGKIILIP